MTVGRLVERQVILLPRHQAAALVGQIVFVVRSAYAHDGGGVEVCLLDDLAGIGFKVFRQFFDGVFLFNLHIFHDRSIPSII